MLVKCQVTKAAKLFRQAGCVSGDIKAALTSHIKHDEIDIPEEAEEPKKVSSDHKHLQYTVAAACMAL